MKKKWIQEVMARVRVQFQVQEISESSVVVHVPLWGTQKLWGTATNQFHLPQGFYLLFDPLFYIILLVLLSRSWTTNESINNLSTGHSQHSQHKCEVGHKTCTSVYGRKVFLYLVLRFAMFSSPYSRIAGIAYNGGPQNRILDFHRSIYGHF